MTSPVCDPRGDFGRRQEGDRKQAEITKVLNISEQHKSPVANQGITEAEYKELLATKAVGDLMGRPLDINGRLVPIELADKAVGISPVEVSDRRCIAIVWGETKAKVTLGVLRSGYIN